MTKKQKIFSIIMKLMTYLTSAITFLILGGIIIYISYKGIPMLRASMFELYYTSDNLSMLPSIINTLTVIFIVLLISIPIGIFTAVYLVEYSKKGGWFIKLIRLSTETLQGIPSIVYGLFGYIFFVTTLGFGYSLIAGVLTMSIMVLPLIIRATEEALIAVDDSYKAAAYSLGARKLRTIFIIILPSAINGIVSGIILAIGRIFGETAALIFTAGAYAQIAKPTQTGSTLSVFMWNLVGEGHHTEEAYAVAFVLLVIVILINLLSTKFISKIGVINE